MVKRWTKDGRRIGLISNMCKRAYTVKEVDGKVYCLGYKNPMTDYTLKECQACTFFIRNM